MIHYRFLLILYYDTATSFMRWLNPEKVVCINDKPVTKYRLSPNRTVTKVALRESLIAQTWAKPLECRCCHVGPIYNLIICNHTIRIKICLYRPTEIAAMV